MLPQRSVLIVDRSEENREVLSTALERRGRRIFATGRARRGLELARRHRPDVIVLDLELEAASPEKVYARFARQSREQGTALVTLGRLRRDQSTNASRRCPVGAQAEPADGEFVAKPYHYGPLIRRIEELLENYRAFPVCDPRQRSGHPF